jgi:uncharacterized protein with PQ loop repeat
VTLHDFSLLCGTLGVILNVWATLAQFQRVRTLGTEGIALATWLLFVLMGLFWIGYGLHEHAPLIILGSLLIWPFQVAIVFRLAFWRQRVVCAQSLALFLLGSLAPMMFWGWSGGILGTGVVMVINRWPQMSSLLRRPDATGVSAVTWLMGVAGSSVWTSYYIADRDIAATWTNAITGVMNLGVLVLVIWRHRQMHQQEIARDIFG